MREREREKEKERGKKRERKKEREGEKKRENLNFSSRVLHLTFTQITFACIWSEVIMAVTSRDGTIPALTKDFSLPSLYARLQNIEAHPLRRFSSLKWSNEEYNIDIFYQ